MKKRVLSLSLALAMATSLTACGSSSSTTETTAAARHDPALLAQALPAPLPTALPIRATSSRSAVSARSQARLLYMVSQLRTAPRPLLMRSTLTAVSTDTRSSLISRMTSTTPRNPSMPTTH